MPSKLASPSPFLSNIENGLHSSSPMPASCVATSAAPPHILSENTAASLNSLQIQHSSAKTTSKLIIPKRSKVTRESLQILNLEFEKCQNPHPEIRKGIAAETGLSERTVRIWFQNKRAKTRKQERDRKQQHYLNPSFKIFHTQNVPVVDVNFTSNNTSNVNLLPASQTNAMPFPNMTNSSNHLPSPNVVKDKKTQKLVTKKQCISSTPKSKIPTIDMGKCIPLYINSQFDYIDSSCIIIDKWQRVKSEQSINLQFIPELLTLSPQDINKLMVQSLDLVIIISKKSNVINYFFSTISNKKKVIFRIYYPLSSISSFNISNSITNIESPLFKNEFNSEISLLLNEPPSFEINFVDEKTTKNTWIKTGDFSINKQVQNCFSGNGKGNDIPHKIIGRVQAIMHLYDYIHNNQTMANSHVYSNLLNYSTSNIISSKDFYQNLYSPAQMSQGMYGGSPHDHISNLKSTKPNNDNVLLPPLQQTQLQNNHNVPNTQHRFSISYPPSHSLVPLHSFTNSNININPYQHRQSLPNLSEYFYSLPPTQNVVGNDAHPEGAVGNTHLHSIPSHYNLYNTGGNNDEAIINPLNIANFTTTHIQQFQKSMAHKQLGSLSSVSSTNSLSLNDYCESFKGASVDIASSSKCSSIQPLSPYSNNDANLFAANESPASLVSTFAKKIADKNNQMNEIQEEDNQPDEIQPTYVKQTRIQKKEQEQIRDCDSPSISNDYLNVNKDNIVSDLQN